jgi:F-type H+-transporting ATPase subunit alpha
VSKAQLERGYRLVELLKQPLNAPMPVEDQVVVLFAGTRGYLDDIPVADVKRFEAELVEFMRAGHSALLDEIKTTGLPGDLGDVIESFKERFGAAEQARSAVDPTSVAQGEVGEAESTKTLATE